MNSSVHSISSPFLPIKPFYQLIIIGSLLISTTALADDTVFSQKPFTDVPASSRYFEGIEYLRTHNVLKGYIDGTFKPDTRINRAEFVKFVVNPLILDTNNMSSCIDVNVSTGSTVVFFSDVTKDAWYATDVCFAKVKHLIDGFPDGTYRPAANINFVEAAKIIANVFSLDIQNQTTGQFWYRPYIQRLSDLHAIPTTIKRFDQTLTRGEMAEMVYRLKADREDKASATIGDIH